MTKRPLLPATIAAVFATLALAVPVAAQNGGNGELAELRMQFENSARKFVTLAEAMPASTYDWSPGDGVASVARVYMHVARYNHMYPHEMMDRETPVGPMQYNRWEDDVSDKDEVTRILSTSMDYVRDVFDAMDESSLSNEVRLYGRTVHEPAVMLQLVAHMNEHLGQSIAYARMNGVVPPWSR